MCLSEQHGEIDARWNYQLKGFLFLGMCKLLKENEICVMFSVFCCTADYYDHLF